MQSLTEVLNPPPEYQESQKPQNLLDAIVLRVREQLVDSERENCDVLSLLQAAAAHAVETPIEAAAEPQPSESFADPQPHVTLLWQTSAFQSFQWAVELEFFDAIHREDLDTITYLVSSGIVKPNTLHITHDMTPLTAALDPYPNRSKSTPPALPPSPELIARLLELGTDPNVPGTVVYPWGSLSRMRTPLMIAAERGLLPLVRMLTSPPVCADDAIVAPDGETALHLAAAAGHAAVVAFLPARRAGGLRRLQLSVRHHVVRGRTELGLVWEISRYIIWPVVKFIVWTVPKFLLWDTPKWFWRYRARLVALGEAIWRSICGIPNAVWGVVKEIPHAVRRAGKASWKFVTQTLPRWGKKSTARVRKLFTETLPEYVKAGAIKISKFVSETIPKWLQEGTAWLRKILTETIPQFLKNSAMWVSNLFTGKLLKWLREGADWLVKLLTEKIPALLKEGALWIKKTLTETLPHLSKEFVLWLRTLFTERIPKALGVIATWIKQNIINLCKAVYDIITRFVSLLHTTLWAAITFLRDVTLRDIWNAICELIRAVFVKFPCALWDCVANFKDISFKVLELLFNRDVAIVVMVIGVLTFELVTYVPRKILVFILRVSLAIQDMIHEVIICINPKTMVHSQ